MDFYDAKPPETTVPNPVQGQGSSTYSIRDKVTLESGEIRSANYIPGTQGWRITSDEAEFQNIVVASAIDIGGADATSFHVDSNGNLWLGASAYASAPFKVSSAGALVVSGATITGSTFQTSTSGQRIVISGSTMDVYDSSDQIVGSFYGGTAAGGLPSAIDALGAALNIATFTDQGIGGDYYSLSTSIDGALGSDGGDLTLSTRLSSGGGNITLVPPTSGRVNIYTRARIIPQGSAPSSPLEGDLYVNSTDHKLYIYTGSAWVVVGTQT